MRSTQHDIRPRMLRLSLSVCAGMTAACQGEENDPGDFGTATETEGDIDNEPPEGCFPMATGEEGADTTGGADTAGDETPAEGEALVCVGEAFGIFRYAVCNTLDCTTGIDPETPDAGCFPLTEAGNLQDLVADACPMPLALPASPDQLGEIPTPRSCCTDAADADDVLESCRQDCAFAACMLASSVLAQQAAEQLADGGIGSANAAADLQLFSDQLATPSGLQLCVDRVTNGELVDFGDGVPNTNEAGDIVDATLEIVCDITATVPADMPDACSQTPNFEEAVAGDPGEGVVVGGSLVVTGPLGDAEADVTGVEFGIRVEPCSGAACGVLLTKLELMTTDLFLGPLRFDDIEVRLIQPAMGIRDGDEILFGTLVTLVTFELSAFNKPIGAFPIIVTSRGPARGRLTDDDEFALDEVRFRLGPQTGTLVVDPSPVIFGLGG